jgi:hypothetical protein
MTAKRAAKHPETEPDLEVFGETWHQGGQHESPGVTGGLFFIFIGTVLLLNSLGLVPWGIWSEVVKLWPLLMILIGFQILLGKSRVSRVIMTILSLLMFATVIGIVLFDYFPAAIQSIVPQEIHTYIIFLKGVLHE